MADNHLRGLRKAIKQGKRLKGYESKEVYLIGDDKLAKGEPEELARHEYEMGIYLFDQGIRVPRFEQLIPPDRRHGLFSWRPRRIKEWYILMERIKGVEIRETGGEILEKALEQYYEEMEKILELGIVPNDAGHGGNVMCEESGRLCLLDFTSWYKFNQESATHRKERTTWKEHVKNRDLFSSLMKWESDP